MLESADMQAGLAEELRAALKAGGARMTPQRQLILEAVGAICASGHFTADAIYTRVRAQFPEVNITTVYRTLELLEARGLVRHTHFHDGVAQYHLGAESGHQHLVCRHCGTEREVDAAVLRPLAQALRHAHDFEADLEHFAIVGSCGRCRAQRPAG